MRLDSAPLITCAGPSSFNRCRADEGRCRTWLCESQIGYHSIKANREQPAAASMVKLSPESMSDVMDALPIFSLAFMAQFNILSVSHCRIGRATWDK